MPLPAWFDPWVNSLKNEVGGADISNANVLTENTSTYLRNLARNGEASKVLDAALADTAREIDAFVTVIGGGRTAGSADRTEVDLSRVRAIACIGRLAKTLEHANSSAAAS